MRTLSILAILSIFVFSGIAYAESTNIVINEIDTNPPGDDAKTISEWVELYNPTDKDVDISGWKIASTLATKKTLTIPTGTTIESGEFLVYTYRSLWFADVSEKVQLRDESGKIIDQTPLLTDQKNNFLSWQRNYDGLDTDTSDDWAFRTTSAGSSNGKFESASSDNGMAVFVNTDKPSYIFDETVLISGNVSKRISQDKPIFTQQQLVITISGPDKFYKTITKYPDRNLEFNAQIKLDKAQRITAGTYDVLVKYGVAQASVQISVDDKQVIPLSEEISNLLITLDKDTYIPGQSALISISTTKAVPLEGLKLSIRDPKGNQIYSGKLYPTKGVFSTNVIMPTIKPVYGTYQVIADYATQHSETTIELVQDTKDTEKIVLLTDKKYYALGDSITISGRSNKYVAALDLEILQTGAPQQLGKHATTQETNKNAFKLTDQIRLEKDSTFEYKVSQTLGLGDYRVTVSKEFGKSVTYFKIVGDPTVYSETENEFVSTEKTTYDVGDKLVIFGQVVPKTRSTFEAIPVHVAVTYEDGKPLTFIGQSKTAGKPSTDPQIKTYSFSAVPDISGSYKIEATITKSIFSPGKYVLTAKYDGKKSSTVFTVTDSLDIGNKKLVVSTDKTVYGLGQTVHLDGTLTTGRGAVQIVLTKPGGKTINGAGMVDDNKFSWTWEIPQKDFTLADIRDPRGERPTVFGTYKISIKTSSETSDVLFKVSKDPANDALNVKPLEITTDKPVYVTGEKLVISGSAVKRQQTISEGTARDRVNVQVKTSTNKLIYDSSLDFDNGGNFKTTYDLPITIFKDGTYKVIAIYQKIRAETTFEMKNNIPLNNNSKLTLSLNTDKEEYSPGQTVHISGSLNKAIFLDQLNLVVLSEEQTKINCGAFYCGFGGKPINIAKYYDSGLYKYDYVISPSTSLGNYVIKVETQFGTFTKTIKVEIPEEIPVAKPQKISEKFNKITDSSIPISLMEKTIQDKTVLPRSLQGSLVAREESINIQVSASGQCIIGQASDCLVSKSTMSSAVQIDGTDFKIQYSGPDTIPEKFTIIPKSDSGVIQNSVWTVDIIKEENQYSKFYYEITYISQ